MLVNRANPIAGRINMSNLCSEILQVNSASRYDDNLDYTHIGHDISCKSRLAEYRSRHGIHWTLVVP